MTEPLWLNPLEYAKSEWAKKQVVENQNDLPTTLTINGKEVPVTWESGGQMTDAFGYTLEIYIPIFPVGILSPDMAESLFNQIKVWDVSNGGWVDLSYTKMNEEGIEVFHPAREKLIEIAKRNKLDLSPQSVFEEVKFNSLRQELVNQGADPSILGVEGVEDFLLEQSKFQQGDKLSVAFVEGLGRIMKEVQANPGNADAILAKYAPSRPQTEAQQIAQWGQQTFQGQQALQTFWGLPKMETFGTEKEYQQNVINQLGKQAEDILASGVNFQELNPLSQAQSQVVGQYQASQQRLKDIEAGAEEAWTPQIAQEQEVERQRLEQEEIKKQKLIKPKKSAMEIDFERLVAESRRPQRVTRL